MHFNRFSYFVSSFRQTDGIISGFGKEHFSHSKI